MNELLENEAFRLKGKIAVVTGAASGLGRALALQCAEAGMKLVLADVDAPGLEEIGKHVASSASCVWLPTDVRHREALDALASLAYASFGAVDVLFNNAGVVIARPMTETSAAECRWVMDVNFWGVFHGVGAFLPRMRAQGSEGRIVNTASAAGFLSVPNLAAYCVSKHAVVAFSECLHQELTESSANIGVTILSPAFVPTNILHSERSRPAELADPEPRSAAVRSAEQQFAKAVGSGRLTAEDVARATLEGVSRRSLHVFPHPKIRAAIEERMSGIYRSMER